MYIVLIIVLFLFVTSSCFIQGSNIILLKTGEMIHIATHCIYVTYVSSQSTQIYGRVRCFKHFYMSQLLIISKALILSSIFYNNCLDIRITVCGNHCSLCRLFMRVGFYKYL